MPSSSSSSSSAEPGSELVPVTVLGGYLGAGKTTILNRLLAGDHGLRLAVLVNDFGAVNLDADLIRSHDGDTVTLENGCVCCSIADALGDALDQVLALDPLPDHIVIETSGAAEPAKVANYGRGWPGCRLDAVIVAADAETVRNQARDRFVGELIIRQLRAADLILATKTDLLDGSTNAAVADWLDRTTEGTAVVSAIRGVVAPEVLLDRRSPPPRDESTRDEPDAGGLTADERFESVAVSIDRPIERDLLERTVSGWPAAVIRVKGIVAVRDHGLQLVQRVGRRLEIEPYEETATDPALVVIARRNAVDLAALVAGLGPVRPPR